MGHAAAPYAMGTYAQTMTKGTSSASLYARQHAVGSKEQEHDAAGNRDGALRDAHGEQLAAYHRRALRANPWRAF